MRSLIALSTLALAAAAAVPAAAQPYGPPPGPYQSQCRDIRMEGQFLHAYCRGARGEGPSSINVASCSTGIFVDASGALACVGPGGGAPPQVQEGGRGSFHGPGYPTSPQPPPPQGYAPATPRVPDYGRDRGEREWLGRRARHDAILYAGRDFSGPSVRIDGAAPNLAATDFNDRARSIRIDPRGGPWIVCSDAGFRGFCTTIYDSVRDTREIGMRRAVSSLRPLR